MSPEPLDVSVVDDAASLRALSGIVGTRALTGGRGGRTWRIDTTDERLVLHRRSSHEASTLLAEVGATTVAFDAGVGPQVLGFDADRGLLLTQWIPGRAATPPTLIGDVLTGAIGALGRLHSAPIPRRIRGGLPRLDPFLVRARYLSAAAGAVALPAWAESLLAPGADADALDALASAVVSARRDEGQVLVHGDPVPGNLIRSADGIRLVDFEYAGLRSAAYELGHLASALHLPQGAIDPMLASYGEAGGVAGVTADHVEAWSYIVGQSWVAWVALGQDLGARASRWNRWAVREAYRVQQACRSRRVEVLAAGLR